jgi:hypothetical protein
MLKWAIVPDRGDQTIGDLRGRQCNAQAAGISSAQNDERPFKLSSGLLWGAGEIFLGIYHPPSTRNMLAKSNAIDPVGSPFRDHATAATRRWRPIAGFTRYRLAERQKILF